ncbi:3-phosphoglycerate dehydrogenase [Novosphingobium sp. FSY-8]|uniref:3-phosphoglycerate dehydrogenase n=2 Tax=Novosphingobium ovatum TaxID=1908523 RepID=A0ABW9X986_9SPHN|nr:3-phosphoglycerate dehydrogenase [Novosphingobium ovatum]
MAAPHIAIFGRALAPQAMALAQEAGARVTTTDTYLRGPDLERFMQENNPDAIILRLGEVTEAAMANAPNLRIIAKHGVGYDTIDVAAATRRNILVTIARGANAISVAEHALALILGVARGIAYQDARIRSGHWDKAFFMGSELNGKVLGVVGLGAIGHALARICAALDMAVQVFDPALPQDAPLDYRRVDSLDQLLATSDVVSLHCPLTPATRNMISADKLALMKPGAILVNTARGGLIDLEALADALEGKQIGGAGLDTFPVEPPELSERVRGLSNLVISPHIGASTIEAGQRVGTMVMQQVLDHLAGRDIERAVAVNAIAG